MNGKTQLLQRKTILELTKVARKGKEEMESYLEDLEMHSKPEFREAINETTQNKGKKFSSQKKLFEDLNK